MISTCSIVDLQILLTGLYVKPHKLIKGVVLNRNIYSYEYVYCAVPNLKWVRIWRCKYYAFNPKVNWRKPMNEPTPDTE